MDDRQMTEGRLAGPGSTGRRWPAWLRALVAIALLLALGLPLLLLREQLFGIFQAREQVVAEIRSAGAWGPLVVIALAIAQVVIAPVPGQIVNFVAAYLYGLWPGALYSWLGLVVGTAVAMGLARYAGRPIVERLVSARMLGQVDRLAAGRGLGFFFLFFLIPGLPDDLLCFFAGLTPLPLRILLPMSAVARIPGLLGSAWLGAYAQHMPWYGWVVLGLLSVAALYLTWRYGERVQAAIMRLLSRRA